MLPDEELKNNLVPITRTQLNEYLKDLGKEFRKLNGTKTVAEIVLVGGAAILARYGFRDTTYDVDAIILASTAMKEAINHVRDKHGLPHGWLNTDFTRTSSYSDRLLEVSTYYRTFSNILTVRTVAAEYLLAMKLMSGRQYKNDLSDIVGILWEHQKNGEPLSGEAVEKAFGILYGENTDMPETSRKLLNTIFDNSDFETHFQLTRESEIESKELLLEFENNNPNALKVDNIAGVIERMKQKRDITPQKDSLLAKLEQAKREAEQNHE